VKHTKLFVFIAVLGTAFITTFLVFLYCSYYLNPSIWSELFASSYYLSDIFGFFLLFGGPTLLVVGVLGIGRQYFKNYESLFTILIVVLVPLLISIMILLIAFFAPPLNLGF